MLGDVSRNVNRYAPINRYALCVLRISFAAVTSKGCPPCRPVVMVTGHVPAVRLPPDHPDDLMAMAVPA
jgi:hypothetical protein